MNILKNWTELISQDNNIYSNNNDSVQNVLCTPVDYTFLKMKTIFHSSQPPQCLADCHHA